MTVTCGICGSIVSGEGETKDSYFSDTWYPCANGHAVLVGVDDSGDILEAYEVTSCSVSKAAEDNIAVLADRVFEVREILEIVKRRDQVASERWNLLKILDEAASKVYVEGDNIAEWCARITDAEEIQPNTTEYPYEGTVVISEAQYEVLKAAAEIIRKSRE